MLFKLGQLDRGAGLDLVQNALELAVASARALLAHRLDQAAEGGRRDAAFENPDLQIVEHVEDEAGAPHRLAPALGRAADFLQGEERVDGTDAERPRQPS